MEQNNKASHRQVASKLCEPIGLGFTCKGLFGMLGVWWREKGRGRGLDERGRLWRRFQSGTPCSSVAPCGRVSITMLSMKRRCHTGVDLSIT